MAGRDSDKIRISPATNECLKRVVLRFPQFSASSLADAFLTEACAAASGESSAELPTVLYLRSMLGITSAPSPIEDRLSRIERIVQTNYSNPERTPSLRVAEEPAKPARKKSA